MTEQQLARMAKRRMAILRHVQEITGNVSLTRRYYGISRQVFYKWRRRYDADGLDGLRDRSHRPQVSSNGTVALSRNVLTKPSKVEALLHGRTPRGPNHSTVPMICRL